MGPLFERFPLKESHFRGPKNPKIFGLRPALPPNRTILVILLGYLIVFALEMTDLGGIGLIVLILAITFELILGD